ncbi:MAG TPA: argininosuccinate lyase, partial [Rhabdaerophilum sp.]|nr:argininosuccinate lyase [Rhabdaerophilum sp.]
AIDVLDAVLPAFTGLVRDMTVRVDRLRAQAGEGFSLATEVADYLAKKGIPFAEAHEITGALVRYCEDMGLTLETIGPADLAAVDPRLDAGLKAHLTLDAAVSARSGHGGTAPERVREQIARFEARVAEARAWAEGCS